MPKTSFLRMLGIVLGWVLLFLLLLCCEAAVVIAYITAVEMPSRIHRQMEHRDPDGRPLGSDGPKEGLAGITIQLGGHLHML